MSRFRRVVIDTSVVVSAFVFRAGRLAWLREAVVNGAAIPLVSDETLAEMVRVLAYPRFGLSPEDCGTIIACYMENAEAIQRPRARAGMPRCRDPHDEMFIRLAYAAKADAVVTGDDDLLALAPESRIPILTPAAFRELG
ncbi:MAG: putative toxin-antitoxin system toxin component, PIN family [Burkholderiales bacterium]|nr:putative toxin-antitoxin system toxin component, PIN family [Burkholderiales bacterium]